MTKKCTKMMLPGIFTGILFLAAGLTKLFMFTPGGFAENMIVPTFGVGVGFALFLAWLVIVVEILGGIALIVKCKAPKKCFKILVSGLIIIVLAAIAFVHIPAQDFMTVIKDLIIVAVLISVLPKGCCKMGKCEEGTSEENRCDGGKCCEEGTCKA